ncbi:MAG: hypothetical protein ACRC8M_04500 [Cetobacterium sp.]
MIKNHNIEAIYLNNYRKITISNNLCMVKKTATTMQQWNLFIQV